MLVLCHDSDINRPPVKRIREFHVERDVHVIYVPEVETDYTRLISRLYIHRSPNSLSFELRCILRYAYYYAYLESNEINSDFVIIDSDFVVLSYAKLISLGIPTLSNWPGEELLSPHCS